MYKFKPGSKAHTTWESSYNPYSDHNYKFARDSRGVDGSGYFLPHNYFENSSSYSDETESRSFVWHIIAIVILGSLSVMLLT